MVLNLRSGSDVVSVIKLNPPYDLMVDLSKVSLGRNLTTATEPNLEPLYQLLVNYHDTQSNLDRIRRLLHNAVKPEGVILTKYLV
jgi:hypothetical protein